MTQQKSSLPGQLRLTEVWNSIAEWEAFAGCLTDSNDILQHIQIDWGIKMFPIINPYKVFNILYSTDHKSL